MFLLTPFYPPRFLKFSNQAGVVKARRRPGRRVVAGLSLAAAALCASFAEAQTGAEVESVTVTNGGSGYTSAPSVTFSGGGGSGATGTASVTLDGVTSVTVTNGGSGYTSAPSVTFSGGGGSGATGTASVTLSAVDSVTVDAGGSGYTSAPSISFSGGGGSGATGTASVTLGAVNSVTVDRTKGFKPPPKQAGTYILTAALDNGTGVRALGVALPPAVAKAHDALDAACEAARAAETAKAAAKQ